MINLVNKEVIHKSFGTGNITDYSDRYISVLFASENKKFVFPDAFEKYLTLTDEEAAEHVKEKLVQKKKDRKAEKKLKQLMKERALEEQKKQALTKKSSRKRGPSYSNKPSIFWIEDEEANEIFANENIFIGNIKSGKNKGTPRRLVQIDESSACLLTERSPDVSEEERRIIGLFMVDKDFSGRNCKDGLIPLHPEYKLLLSKEEAEKMLFWDYYIDDRNPKRKVWNSGRHRYFDNEYVEEIIRDIITLKEVDEEKEYVKKFYQYFCSLNSIE